MVRSKRKYVMKPWSNVAYVIVIALSLCNSILMAQEKNLVQVKTFDELLVPFSPVEISINGQDFISINKKGTAFVEIHDKDLPPKSIKVNNETLEAASWNYSKGVLEIIIRKRNYKVAQVLVTDQQNRPVNNLPVTFNGKKIIATTTNTHGVIELPISLDESIYSTDQFNVNNYKVTKLINTDGARQIIIQRIKSKEETAAQNLEEHFLKDFDLKNLDSIRSLTVFYAVFKNYQIAELNPATRQLIDTKFNQLMVELQDSLRTQKASFIGHISDSSFVKDDLRNLLSQASAENGNLDLLREDFNEKIRIVRQKLAGGISSLDPKSRTELISDIKELERVLMENANKFYKNQSDYLSILNSLKENFFDVQDLENKLQVSETQRREEQKDFQKKIGTILGVTLLFALLIILLIYFGTKLKSQQKQLIKAHDAIKNINENLESLVYERTKMLESANHELDTFLYRASHDLRGPIRSIMGLCNIAIPTSDPESRLLFEKIFNTANGMDKMSKKLRILSEINEPTDYSKIELHARLVEFHDIFSKQIAATNATFIIECAEDLTLNSYPHLIQVIFFNLIENALFFASIKPLVKPEVIITASIVDDYVQINIRDNGIGIDHLIQERVWDMFFIGDIQSKGNGLGLYIVNKSVAALNGKITFETVSGSYCNFSVLIPLFQEGKSSYLPPVQKQLADVNQRETLV